MSISKIDGRHISAARDLLRMSQEDLAKAADVSELRSKHRERKTLPESTIEKVRAALERRGISLRMGTSPVSSSTQTKRSFRS